MNYSEFIYIVLLSLTILKENLIVILYHSARSISQYHENIDYFTDFTFKIA